MKLKTTLWSIAATCFAAPAIAGSFSTMPMVEDTGGGSNAGIVVLLVIGALLVLNGAGVTQSKTRTGTQDTSDNDDDILMRF